MSDLTDDTGQGAKNFRRIITGATLMFCFSIIVALIYKGTAGNSLHESAMSWAWFGVVVILAGTGLSFLQSYIPTIKLK